MTAAAVFGKDPASAYPKFCRYLLAFFTLSNKIICLSSEPWRNRYSTKLMKMLHQIAIQLSFHQESLQWEIRKIDNIGVNKAINILQKSKTYDMIFYKYIN